MEFQTLNKIGLQPGSAKGHVVAITGAGEGIGRAAACAFAWLGARVIIAEISDEGQETERLIRQAGGQAIFVRTDISDPGQVAAMAKCAQESFGAVDVLINNAIICPVAAVTEMEPDLWDRVMAVNLRGPFLTCKAFLPGMLSANRGVIVNMISTDAMTHLSAYIASKQGLVGLSQSLAAEVASSEIHVVAFAPGFVATRSLRAAAQGLAPELGLDMNQFLNLSLHPDYPGAMPVEDAAAATAYLVLKLASEYRGEVTNGYAVLEQAGYLSAAPVQFGELPAQPAARQPDSLQVQAQAPAKAQAFENAVQLCEQLQAGLALTEAEVDKLPIFVRPMVRGGFKSKAGQSLQDWKRSAATLTDQFKMAASGDAEALKTLQGEAPRWAGMLDKLESYYLGMPAGAASVTKDKEFLAMVQKQSEERSAVVRAVKACLP